MRIRPRIKPLFYLTLMLSLLSSHIAWADNNSLDWSQLFTKVSPAVVNIGTTTLPKKQHQSVYPTPPNLEQLPPMFRYFFQIPSPQQPSQQPRRSLGSGFILSHDGYILTNNHVVTGADEIMVRLSDRRELKAKVIGFDEKTDLALLKVNAKNLPIVSIGDSDHLIPGQPVAAIGSPFGFDHSITSGIVSALNRSLPNGHENYVPFIQTDVPINPGNSGGPLLNTQGQVIGINSQIYTQSGGFMGLSFAIPIDTAMNVVKQLRSTGHVVRGWLGVYVQEVNSDLAESFGLKRAAGALVSQVVPNSPAAKAKVEPGDVIIQFNNQPISVSGDLPHIVARMKPNDKANMVVLRNGKPLTLAVTIEALAPDKKIAAVGQPEKNNHLGVEVRALSNHTAKHKVAGVQIVAIDPQGLAASLGLRKGDIISSINNTDVNNMASFKKLTASLKSDTPNNMRIIRGKTALFLTFRAPKKEK